MKKLIIEASRELKGLFWRRVFAENVAWASCEALLQAALLYEINRRPRGRYLVDREKRLEAGWTPDLVFFPRRARSDWALADRPGKRALATGIAQLKLAWTRGSSTGSAIPSQRVQAILRDAERTRRLAGSTPCFFGVLIAGVDHRRRIADEVQAVDRLIEDRLDDAGWRLFCGVPVVFDEQISAPFRDEAGKRDTARVSLHWYEPGRP